MTKGIRALAHRVSETGRAGHVEKPRLDALINFLQRSPDLATADDIEWLRVLSLVQGVADECERAADFRVPDPEWRTLGLPFNKMKKLYDDMERTGAIEDILWSMGGYAHVTAHDIRAIRQFLARQVQMRIRSMGLAPPQQGTQSRWTKVGNWMSRNVRPILITALGTVVGGVLLTLLL